MFPKWKKVKNKICGPPLKLWRRPVTQPAVNQNHQQVSCLAKCTRRLCTELRAPVTMRSLCSSGCQPVCPRVRFPYNLHLTFRLMAFLSPFSRLISFEEITFEPQQTLTDSDGMTHTHTTQQSWFRWDMSLATMVDAVCWIVFNKLTTNCVICFVCIMRHRHCHCVLWNLL